MEDKDAPVEPPVKDENTWEAEIAAFDAAAELVPDAHWRDKGRAAVVEDVSKAAITSDRSVAVAAWDAGLYARGVGSDCGDGDPGSLNIRAVGNYYDLRDGNGIVLGPLPYGQSQVLISVSRPAVAPQCPFLPH